MGPNVGLRYFRQMETCYNWHMIVKGKSPDAGRAEVPTDLVDPAPGSSLRRTGPGGHQPIQAKAHCENDPATPKPGLSDRSAESTTQPSTSAVIFDPDLVDPAPRSSLRRTRPSCHQTIEAKAHCENDPATPKPRLSDRSAESSTQPSTSTVIFRAWGGTVLSRERRGTTCLAPGARCAGFQRRRVSCGRR